MASVVTYAHGTSHDAYYFDHPEAIIAGDVRAPVVYVENQQVLRRHVNAYLIQRFFHERVTGGGEVYSLFESLGTVEAFLSGRYDCSLAGLTAWLKAREADLLAELGQWVPRHSHGLAADIAGVDVTIGSAVPELLAALAENLPVTDYGRREELSGPVREGLERRLEEELLVRLSDPVACPTAERAGRPGRAGRAALTSLVQAVTLAASRTLQVDEGELGGNWCPVAGGGDREAYLFLYDLLPGGAGYTRLVHLNLDAVLAAADALLAGCRCEGSCYSCLRHFGNTFLHPSLDRHLALALLRHVRGGTVPRPEPAEKEAALAPLKDLLRLQATTFQADAARGGCVVPLLITRPGGTEVWVDVRHPLVDAGGAGSDVARAAEADLVECCLLDTFTLRHDLPAAVAALQL